MESSNPWENHSSNLVENPFAKEFELEDKAVENPFKDELETEQQQEEQEESKEGEIGQDGPSTSNLHIQSEQREAEGDEEEDDEVFVYPGTEEDEDEEAATEHPEQLEPEEPAEEDEEDFEHTPHASTPFPPVPPPSLPPPSSPPRSSPPPPTLPPPPPKPTVSSNPVDPSLLPPPLPLSTTISSLINANDLRGLKNLLLPSEDVINAWEEREGSEWPGAWKLSNEMDGGKGRIGGLGLAAKWGYLEIVRFLVDDCGAMVDLQDSSGETALHKSSLAGHLNVVIFLLQRGADVNATDTDLYTPLHNACSSGHLSIVRYLLTSPLSSPSINPSPLSSTHTTPLMLASSRGHLPIVSYLTSKSPLKPDPFIRNKSHETAFDCAAAAFEVRICEILVAYEREWLKNQGVEVDGGGYDVWNLHDVLPVRVWENQRLDLRVGSLARWGKGRWRAEAVSERDGVGRWEVEDWDGGKKKLGEGGWEDIGLGEEGIVLRELPTAQSSKSKVKSKSKKTPLPPLPTSSSTFYFSSPPIPDLTHPYSSPSSGWQYARSFDTPDSEWTAEPGEDLNALLEGRVTVVGGVGKWVRRRRWVRVVRRKTRSEVMEETEERGKGKEREELEIEAEADDYVSEAQKRLSLEDPLSIKSPDGESRHFPQRLLKTSISLLEVVTNELRNHILADEDKARRGRASKLLDKLFGRLELLEASLRDDLADEEEVMVWGLEGEVEDEDGDEDDKSVFTYTAGREDTPPITSVSVSPPSSASVSGSRVQMVGIADLPEVQLPMDEAPIRAGVRGRWEMQRVDGRGRWIPVSDCSGELDLLNAEEIITGRMRRLPSVRTVKKNSPSSIENITAVAAVKFSARIPIPANELVREPGDPELWTLMSGGLHRVCDSCHQELQLPPFLRSSPARNDDILAIASPTLHPGSPLRLSTASSDVSELGECPV